MSAQDEARTLEEIQGLDLWKDTYGWLTEVLNAVHDAEPEEPGAALMLVEMRHESVWQACAGDRLWPKLEALLRAAADYHDT